MPASTITSTQSGVIPCLRYRDAPAAMECHLMKQPDEIGGAETQSAYLVVPDADAVYARAKAAGGRIVMEIRDEDYGGRGFSCIDPQGHLWSVGTYDPWKDAGG